MAVFRANGWMLATGVLNLEYRKRVYSMFVALVGVEEAPLRCVHSRTGPYTKGEMKGQFLPQDQEWEFVPKS